MNDFLKKIRNDHRDFYSVASSDHAVENTQKIAIQQPFEIFSEWLQIAIDKQCEQPNACVLATVNEQLQPSTRIVYLKELDGQDFVFYTNYRSRKGQEIAHSPKISLLFYWAILHRQIRIEGTCQKVSAVVSDAYFESRPRESKIGAWASQQSEVLPSRKVLDERLKEIESQFPDHVPRPDHWGGYALRPDYIEFWQGQPSRLHERTAFKRTEDQHWSVVLLNP